MTPLSHAQTELRLMAQRAVQLAEQCRAERGNVSDTRTQIIGELLDTIDAVDPGTGTKLLLAMYPLADVLLAGASAGAKS